MMKKVLYGVALTLFASVSVGSLQSCKDDVNDLATQTSYDLSKLQAQLNSTADYLEGKIDKNAADIRLKADIDWVQAFIDQANGKFSQLDATDAAMQGDIAALQAGVDAINNALDDVNNSITDLNSRLEAVENLPNTVNDLTNSVNDLTSRVEYLEAQRDIMRGELDYLNDYVQTLATNADLEEAFLQIQQTQEYLTQLINLHNADMDEVRAQLDMIVTAIDNLVTRLDKQVTGILIQGVYSPVFGDFSLPIGIRSNILFNWYGKNSFNDTFIFPESVSDHSATGEPGADFAALYPDTYQVPAGFYGGVENDKVALGKVYVTLNPVGAKFSHLEVNLETSAGTKLPWPVTLEPSDYELGFGTRSEDNGFYEGEVIVPANELSQSNLNVQIEEGLKESMKNIIKNPSLHTAKNFVLAVYDQLSGKIPAYALRYGWNTSLEDMDPEFSSNAYAVLSQYDLAVATAKPLSYNFLAGYQGSAKLPEIGHIENLINRIKEEGGKLKFELGDPIQLDSITLSLGEIEIGTINTELTVDLSGAYIDLDDGEGPRYLEFDNPDFGEVDGLNAFQDSLRNELQKAFDKVGKNLNDQINDELIGKINEKLANMFNDLDDQINGKIEQVINAVDKLQPYYGKIDKVFDLYNKIANKVNAFLTDPNAYLQVTAFYNMGNNYGIVSGRAEDPTPFNMTTGGQFFKLYLSSYTGELIVPACKKYVAVTKVYNKVNGQLVEDTNADLISINDKANGMYGADEKKINTGLLDGNEVVVMVKADAFEQNKVYEFTYQALDYQGWTSTKKFYIEVK